MSRRSKEQEQAWVAIGSDVVRQIRQHARSSMKTEVCGVLIGSESGDSVEIEACIHGLNADQAGAHVTFTQDTWEHIYKVKDQQFPNHRIVGWYHSHPGFGIFLSDHDTFIHKNFFSSPKQVAWVYDPHSEEEGCFGWIHGHIERLTQIRILDRQGGQDSDVGGRPEPIIQIDDDEPVPAQRWEPEPEDREEMSLAQLSVTILSHLSVLLLGFIIGWYFFPKIVLVPVPVDPYTGKPLIMQQPDSDRSGAGSLQDTQPQAPGSSSKPGKPDSGKADHGQR
ncbi:MAG TPA: Mov34/MPN/PAD-1 family protein [Terriglobales bacterium]|nr:Mov34/MPN/PAD-1 family protein [Terriglobales bacterium]